MKKLSKLLLAITFTLSITSSAFAVVVASWGGAYTESQKLGYGDPTAAKLGVPIDWVDYSGGLSEIKAQAEAGAITWDIMDVFAYDTINGCDEGIFVEFDFDKDFPPAPEHTSATCIPGFASSNKATNCDASPCISIQPFLKSLWPSIGNLFENLIPNGEYLVSRKGTFKSFNK